MTLRQTDELDALLRGLPPELGRRVRALDGLEGLLEIVMDLGRLPEARFTGREETLSDHFVSEYEVEPLVIAAREEIIHLGLHRFHRGTHRHACHDRHQASIARITAQLSPPPQE